jgi:serine/threonine protein kinase
MAYLAPEMLERKGHGFSLDWYLLGVVIFELIVGYPPFYDRDRAKLFHNIRAMNLPKPPKMSNSCWELVKGLLERNPQKRLGAKEDSCEVK